MAPDDVISNATSDAQDRWSGGSVTVVSNRTDPTTDKTVVDLVVTFQGTSPLPPTQQTTEPPKVSTEIGRVDYYV